MIESVFEDMQLKEDLFNQMGEILKQRCVPADQMLLCSNTMNLSLGWLKRPREKQRRRGLLLPQGGCWQAWRSGPGPRGRRWHCFQLPQLARRLL